MSNAKLIAEARVVATAAQIAGFPNNAEFYTQLADALEEAERTIHDTQEALNRASIITWENGQEARRILHEYNA